MKFGDVYRRKHDGLTVMLLVPGNDDGVMTDENISAHGSDWVSLVLDRGAYYGSYADEEMWPALGTAVWNRTQLGEWEQVG